MNFDSNIAIYIQIMEDLKRKIINGKYKSNDKVESVRDLAITYGVNPNTVQRSLSELEREGLLYSERGSGRFITKDEAILSTCKEDYANQIIDTFINEMQNLHMDKETVLHHITRRFEEHE